MPNRLRDFRFSAEKSIGANTAARIIENRKFQFAVRRNVRPPKWFQNQLFAGFLNQRGLSFSILGIAVRKSLKNIKEKEERAVLVF